jgi:hypothetical protein
MIDRAARDKLADDLCLLIAGEMTNDQFDNTKPDEPCSDLGVTACWEFGYCLHSSDLLFPYRLRGRHAVSPEAREVAHRVVLFLKSDLEYEWPKERGGVEPFFGMWTPGFHLLLGSVMLWFAYLAESWWYAGVALVGFIYPLRWVATYSAREEAAHRFRESGDVDVWPFIRREDLAAAAR